MDNIKHLVEREIPHLRRFAYLLLRNRTEADDLVQDTLERAWRKRHLWRRQGSLRAWMFRILYTTFLNSRRKLKPHTVEFDEHFHTDVTGNASSPQEMQIELKNFARILDMLPEEQRAAIILVALEDVTYETAADMLDIPLGTLRSRLFRGRDALSQMMEQDHSKRKHGLRRVK